jgi:hypothetical protein
MKRSTGSFGEFSASWYSLSEGPFSWRWSGRQGSSHDPKRKRVTTPISNLSCKSGFRPSASNCGPSTLGSCHYCETSQTLRVC